MDKPSIDPLAWVLGIAGTIFTGWTVATTKTQSDHAQRITAVETGQKFIIESLERIEDRLETRRK
jgi:hypothetical protein